MDQINAAPSNEPPPPRFDVMLEPSISERFLLGDAIKASMTEIRLMQVGWPMMTEAQQSAMIDRHKTIMERTLRKAVEIIASKERPAVHATIDTITFGPKTIKAQILISKQSADRHAIADASGQTLLLVLPKTEEVLTGDAPKPTPDNFELPLDDDNSEGGTP